MKQEKATYRSLADFAAWELEAYADGVEIPHLAQFLAANPAIAATWQREQQALTGVQTALYRFDCPASAQIQDYYWQQLPTAERSTVQAHLQDCPHCRQELSQLRAFLAPQQPMAAATQLHVPHAQPVPESTSGWRGQVQEALDQLRIVVANLLMPPTPQWAGVALRGEADPATSLTPQSFLFEADETAISLLIQKELAGTLLLSGQILAVSPDSQSMVKLIPQATDTPAYSAQTDATGNFTFPALHPGSYQLHVALADRLIVVPVFTI